ncbi:MAG: hypothetical protein U1E93_04565 [Alphaproteobacteria bacterium]
MKRYRICSLYLEGQVNFAVELTCRDDLHALSEGESVSAQHAVEIWDGARLVARVKAGNAALTAQDHHSL